MLTGVVSAVSSFVAPTAQADGVEARFAGMETRLDLVGDQGGQTWWHVPAGVLRLEIGGQAYAAYCIEFWNQVINDVDRYVEAGWSRAQIGSDLARITWILHHAYPNRSAAALGAELGLPLTDAEAAAATQAAIWHFSDGFTLAEDEVTVSDGSVQANPPAVVALYRHLIDPAVNPGLTTEPEVSLALEPEAAVGVAGARIGPFTVRTTATRVELSTDGGPADVVVDATGTPVSSAADGDEVFVQVPAGTGPGSLALTATGMAGVQAGRVFVTRDPDGPQLQKLVLAAAAFTRVEDRAVVSWSAVPVPAPEATVAPSCAGGGVVVTLTNGGDGPLTFRVADVSGFERVVEVPAGGTIEVTVPVAAGASYGITVTAGDWSREFTGVLDCDAPPPADTLGATAVLDCAAGGVRITLANGSADTVGFRVGGAGTDRMVAVPGGGREELVVPVAEGAAYDLTVTAEGFTRSFTGTRSCELPVPACTAIGAHLTDRGVLALTLASTGTATARFVITTADGSSRTVDVGPGHSETVEVPVTAPTTVTVTCGSSTWTFTAGPPPAPTVLEAATEPGTGSGPGRPLASVAPLGASLPVTGSDLTQALLVLGVGFLGSGGLLLAVQDALGGRRDRHRRR